MGCIARSSLRQLSFLVFKPNSSQATRAILRSPSRTTKIRVVRSWAQNLITNASHGDWLVSRSFRLSFNRKRSCARTGSRINSDDSDSHNQSRYMPMLAVYDGDLYVCYLQKISFYRHAFSVAASALCEQVSSSRLKLLATCSRLLAVDRTTVKPALMIDNVMPLRSGLAHEGHQAAFYYYYYYCYTSQLLSCTKQLVLMFLKIDVFYNLLSPSKLKFFRHIRSEIYYSFRVVYSNWRNIGSFQQKTVILYSSHVR